MPHDPMFAGTIEALPGWRNRLVTERVDEMPASLPRHYTIGGECAMEHAVEVDVHHATRLVWA
jgi:hypothetical protein